MIDIWENNRYSDRGEQRKKIADEGGKRIMAQAMVNFRMDENLKKDMEATCKKMGLTMTAAFTMFAAKVTREQRIPFEVCVDPFYSEENMARLQRAVQDINAGKNVQEHDLLEEE